MKIEAHSEINTFQTEGFTVREVAINDEPWFIAKDVAEALGYSETNRMTARLDSDEFISTKLVGMNMKSTIINESGLYSAILGSNKKEAKRFKKWVTSEVLPSIRKRGMYATEITTEKMLADPDFAIALLQDLKVERLKRIEAEKTKAEIGTRREATAMNTASQAVKRANKLEEELDQSKRYCTIKRMSMLTHGQRYRYKLLRDACKELNIEPIEVFDSNYGTVKAYPKEAWLEAYGIVLEDTA